MVHKKSALQKNDNSLSAKVDQQLSFIDKIAIGNEYSEWWNSLEEIWKIIFRAAIKIESGLFELEIIFTEKKVIGWQEKINYYDEILKDIKNHFEKISPNSLYHIRNNLKEIIVKRAEINDIMPLRQLNYLEILIIDHPKISDLQPVYHLESLKELDIKISSIPKEQILYFKESHPNCRVKY